MVARSAWPNRVVFSSTYSAASEAAASPNAISFTTAMLAPKNSKCVPE